MTHFCESRMLENCMSGLSGGRGPALRCAPSDPTARNLGNSRGAKGPCQQCVFARDEEIRLDNNPPTEDATTPPPTIPGEPERIGTVTFPQKVSELRQKLGQKAKQETGVAT